MSDITVVSQPVIVEVSPQVYTVTVSSVGAQGAAGVGVPTGGTTGQVLAKINSTNYNTQWVNASAGSGTVTNVTGTSPIQVATGTTTPVVSIDQTALSITSSQISDKSSTLTTGIVGGGFTKHGDVTIQGNGGIDIVSDPYTSQITVRGQGVKGAANGVASLDGSGLVPTTQIPPLAISDTFVVASQAAMLALTAQVGDVAVRTDVNKTFILQTEPASTLANWIQVLTPPAVTSITASSPLTGGTITSTGTIGIDQTALAITSGQVSGLATSATTDTTNASNITSGTLANGRTTATNANTASAIVARDASGNFSAGVISATAISGLTTPLSVGQGGTGQSTLTSGNVLIGNGTGGITTTGVTQSGEGDKIVKTNTAGRIVADSVGVGGNNDAVIGLYNATNSNAQELKAVSASVASSNYLPTTSGSLVSTGDTGTVTNTMLAGSISTAKITGLATSATTDTTNASNITSGTLAVARGGTGVTTGLTVLPGANIVAGVATITGTTYSVGATDYLLICNNSAALTITLPTASSNTGRVLKLVKYNTSSIISASSNVGSLTAGTAQNTFFVSNALAGRWCEIISNGTVWQIVGQN